MTIVFFAILCIFSVVVTFARSNYFEQEKNEREEELDMIVNESKNSPKEGENMDAQEKISENNIVRSANYTQY